MSAFSASNCGSVRPDSLRAMAKGSNVLDVDGNRMDVKFLRETGTTPDYFTVIKGGASAPPAAPTGLTAIGGNAQVALSWTASSGATSYKVKRATTSGGPYTTITNVTTTSFTDTGLSNGTTYYYVVSALNAAGEGADSTQTSATPQAPAPPASPTALTATGGKNKITLRWTQSTSPNLQFNRIYRSNTSGGPYTQIAQIAPKTVYNDNVAAGATRYYVVTAVNTSGAESAASNQATATAR